MTIMALTKGLRELMPLIKEIEEEQILDNKKIVKLRFTSRQYSAFRDACNIFDIISKDPGFVLLVKSALDADIKEPTIKKQLVDPIVSAPTKIPIKIPKNVDTIRKDTYFTSATPLTESVKELYKHVSKGFDKTLLKQNIDNNVTCVTDVRILLTRYIEIKNLKSDTGIQVDKFLRSIAPKTIAEFKDILGSKLVIPKGDRKVILGIINEITF